MKINQFARLEVDFETELTELQRIHFIETTDIVTQSPTEVLAALLHLCYPEMPTQQGVDFKLSTLLVDAHTNTYDFIQNEHEISQAHFYNLAMQLLQFEVDLDFSLDNPTAAMSKMALPFIAAMQLTTKDLLHAWYLLLTTHTKNGQVFLDYLTTKGYFAELSKQTDLPKPLFFNGKAQAVFDTTQLIREVVYVESDQDTDHDGKRDLLKAEILRPVETDDGLSVPVLYTASPYNQGTNDEDGAKLTHNVDVPLQKKPVITPTLAELDAAQPAKVDLPPKRVPNGVATHAEQSFARESSYTLNDYFLARGFAVVYAAGIGTMESDGFRTTGDPEETTSTVAIIEWLAGDRQAFTNKTDNDLIEAWWSNGHTAITGRSYLGTLAIAAATSGVKGLDTIISEAAISSWYDYYRENGLVIAPGGFQGEDADVLAEETFSRQKQASDYYPIKADWLASLEQMGRDQDRETGNYTPFWDARNYLKQLKNIKADIMMIHGLNDWNVKPKNVWKLWRGLQSLPVQQKLILHQGQHIYINNFRSVDYTDIVNLWLSNKLMGVDNHANDILPDVLVQDNTKPETWDTYTDWGNSDAYLTYHFDENQLLEKASATNTVQFTDHLTDDAFSAYKSDYATWRHDLMTATDSPMSSNRLLFKSAPLDHELVLGGRPQLKLRVASSQDVGLLSVRLVDYGKAKRLSVSPQLISRHALDEGFRWREDDLKEFALTKASDAKLISLGHINLQNLANAYQTNEIVPNQFYDLTLGLQPTVFRLLKGHQVGVIVYATDMEMTVRGNQAITYQLDLANCSIELPLQSK